MRVLVLGAGVVGVTAAWYLAQDGHEVTVVDRHDGAALETSFANGGQISASYAEPWANPKLWWPDDPSLYLLRATVKVGGKAVDVSDTRFGFRVMRR